jgi:hypothetical protein
MLYCCTVQKAEQEVIAAQSAHAEALKQTAAVHAAELAEKTANVQAVEVHVLKCNSNNLSM